MRKWIIGLGAFFLTGALVASVVAGPGGWHRGWGGHMGPGYGGHMMGPGYGGGPWGGGPGYGWNEPRGSGLTLEQTQKLDQLREKHWEETRTLREDLFAKRQELGRLYGQQNPDQEAIERLQKETFDLSQKLQERNFAFQKEAREMAPEYQGRYGAGQGWGRGMRGGYGGGRCWGGY